MKKLIALVFVALSVLGMAVGEEPLWISNVKKYVRETYSKEEQGAYVFYYAQSAEGATGRGTAKNLAQRVFRSDLFQQLKSVVSEHEEGNIHDFATDDSETEIPPEQYANQQLNRHLESWVTKQKFSDFEFEEYYYESNKNSRGETRWVCFVLGRIPRAAIFDLFLSIQKDVEKEVAKEYGTVSEDVKTVLNETIEDYAADLFENLQSN